MIVTCLFFAGAKDIVGSDSVSFTLEEGTNTTQFEKILVTSYPLLLKIIENCILSVNLEYVFEPRVLFHNDEIALIPPISGG